MVQLVAIVSAACALGYCVLVHRAPGIVRTIVKTASTASLALLCWLSDGPVLLTIALTLGSFGDFFLSLDQDKGFLPGLGSFLLGHIALVWLIWPIGGGVEAIISSTPRMIAALGLLVLAGCVIKQLWVRVGDLKLPVTLYVIVILSMGIAAATLPFGASLHWVIMGAALFIISDFLLSQHLFVVPQSHFATPIIAVAVWVTYWLAQVAFLAGFLMLIA